MSRNKKYSRLPVIRVHYNEGFVIGSLRDKWIQDSVTSVAGKWAQKGYTEK
jgi:hypothetical protein